MNLQKLFEMQAELDKRIVEEKGLQGQDLLDKKILALHVELGELANEFRGFKFWSEDQEPRKGGKCNCDDGYLDVYMGDGVVEQKMCERCNGTYEVPNTLLEEYVDCLHFLLSIGNDLGVNRIKQKHKHRYDIETAFIHLFMGVGVISTRRDSVREDNYKMTFSLFLRLGEMLGFTWEQIVDAYYKKNEINHERQENGY